MFNLFKNENRIKDPICAMSVDMEKTKFKSQYNGKMYYFCSENCKMTFDADKEMYAQ